MSYYRKFLVATVGAVVMIGLRHYGYNDPALNDLVSLLTAGGVYVAPNSGPRTPVV